MAILRRSRTPEQAVAGKERQEYLQACATFEDNRCADYRTFEDFYNGRRQPPLDDRQRLYLQQAGIVFTENVCATVVDKLAQRLHLEGLQVQDNDEASEWLSTTVFPRNGGDELQGVVHTNTGMLGDYMLICGWDNARGLPTWRANHPRLVKVEYDDTEEGALGDPVRAVKKWSSSKVTAQNPAGTVIWRMNVYHPERVEKYFSLDSEGKQWAIWRDDPGEGWPVWWTLDGTPDGEPIGVPVVHFRNKPLGDQYGRSELRSAVPFQLEHTKNILDQFRVMDAQGWAWPYVTGYNAEADGRLNLAVGDVVTIGNENAKVGQLPAADPTRTLGPIKGTLQRLAAFTDTPLHNLLVEGVLPSGESLKTAESGIVKKAEDRQSTLGNAWARASRVALRLGSAFADLPFEYDPEAQIVPVWDSAETRDEAIEMQNAMFKHELGVSKATLLRELGYDPEHEAQARAEEDAAATAQFGPLPGALAVQNGGTGA